MIQLLHYYTIGIIYTYYLTNIVKSIYRWVFFFVCAVVSNNFWGSLSRSGRCWSGAEKGRSAKTGQIIWVELGGMGHLTKILIPCIIIQMIVPMGCCSCCCRTWDMRMARSRASVRAAQSAEKVRRWGHGGQIFGHGLFGLGLQFTISGLNSVFLQSNRTSHL